MKIEGVNNCCFQCRKSSVEKLRDYGKVIQDTGVINGKKVDIYTAYDSDGNILHKLYYLADNLGVWIKSKLKFYKDGKCYKVVQSENKK